MEYFALILFFIFLTLKLAGVGVVATWSWWYVFMPAIILFVVECIVVYLNWIEYKKNIQHEIAKKAKWQQRLDEMRKG